MYPRAHCVLPCSSLYCVASYLAARSSGSRSTARPAVPCAVVWRRRQWQCRRLPRRAGTSRAAARATGCAGSLLTPLSLTLSPCTALWPRHPAKPQTARAKKSFTHSIHACLANRAVVSLRQTKGCITCTPRTLLLYSTRQARAPRTDRFQSARAGHPLHSPRPRIEFNPQYWYPDLSQALLRPARAARPRGAHQRLLLLADLLVVVVLKGFAVAEDAQVANLRGGGRAARVSPRLEGAAARARAHAGQAEGGCGGPEAGGGRQPGSWRA